MKTLATLLSAAMLCATVTTAFAVTETPSDYEQEVNRMGALIAVLPADAAMALTTAYAECINVHQIDWSPCDHFMDEAAARAGIVEAQ